MTIVGSKYFIFNNVMFTIIVAVEKSGDQAIKSSTDWSNCEPIQNEDSVINLRYIIQEVLRK